jgi:hypothetical protein
MTVTVVTYRKGGNPEAVTAAARKGKAVWEKHGAERFMLNFVAAGPDPGHWSLVIMFSDWNAFGKAMHGTESDPAFREFLSEMDTAAELVSRRLLGSVDL